MKKNNLKRFLASLLAVLMLASVTGVSPAVFAAGNDAAAQSEETAPPVLRDGETVIPKGSDAGTVKKILAKSLISNYDQLDPDSRDNLDWEFECVGWQKFDSQHKFDSNTVFGDINGFESHKDKKIGLISTTLDFQHDALASQADGSYKVRLKSNPDTVVLLSKVAKLSSNIVANNNVSVKLVYNDDGTINYANINEAVFKAAVKSSTPTLTVNDVNITYKAKSGLDTDWMPLKGGKGTILTYPGVTEGTHRVKIAFPGNDKYYSKEVELDVTFLGREASAITFKENPVVKITYEEKDGNVEIKFDDLYKAIWENVVESTVPELSLDDVTIKYHATATTGSVGEQGKEWMPLEGGTAKWNGTFDLTYPAISEGDQELRFEFKGNANYTGFSKDITVKFEGRDPAFEIIPGVTKVDMKFASATSYDYEATANAIREAVVKKLAADESINLSDVTVEYNAAYVGTTFKPLDNNLDNKDITTKKLTADEEFTFRLSWGGSKGTAMYKPFSEEVKLTLVDNRAASSIVLKKNASITYNMDAENMKEQIFKNAIDWDSENTKLPAKETLTPDDFVITYYAEAQIKSGTDIGDELLKKLSPYMHKWVGIEGEENTILEVGVIYPQMGAGEQQIRIQYVGNKEYRPSTEAEGNLTVKKADVKVKVHSTSIYPNEVPGDDFVTLNPNDPAIDVYVIYGGVTSNLSGSIYLQLPSTNPNLVNAINKALEYMGKPPLQEGITVGELKAILNEIINFGGENSLMQEAIKLILKQYGIDYGTLKNIINALNKLPSLSDNVRIVIGFPPNHAGLYLAIAVTDNENYNTAIGTGLLTVKMRVAGVKIQLNDNLTRKLTVDQAKALAADPNGIASLLYNGEAVKNPNLHFLYSGVQSNFRPYSSTTDFPTEPGRYVVTVVTLGGDYLASPVTRSFQITK